MSAVIESKVQNPASMLQVAIERGASMEQLEKLLELQQRWEANEARKAFVVAMAEFKAHPPEIVKDKAVAFSGTSYRHATLANVVDAVVLELSKHGLSHRWEVSQVGATITVTCVITHVAGHSESVSLTALPDDSGKKNAIQQVASTVTYLQRYTLMSALGLAAKDQTDDDGRGTARTETISEQQQATLIELMDAAEVPLDEFFRVLKMPEGSKLADVPAERYESIARGLQKRIK